MAKHNILPIYKKNIESDYFYSIKHIGNGNHKILPI